MKMVMGMKHERCLHASAEAGLVPWRLLLVTCVPQSASLHTGANIATSPHTGTGAGDWQYTMWDATKVLCQAKTFDMDKHLNLISTFKILIILNKR